MCTIAWNSPRSFWMGVPDRIIRRRVSSSLNIFAVLLFADLSLWPESNICQIRLMAIKFRLPSSHITRPIGGLKWWTNETYELRHLIWDYLLEIWDFISVMQNIIWFHWESMCTDILTLQSAGVRSQWSISHVLCWRTSELAKLVGQGGLFWRTTARMYQSQHCSCRTL